MRDAEKPFADFEDDFCSALFTQMTKACPKNGYKRGMISEDADKTRILRDAGLDDLACVFAALRRRYFEPESIEHV